MPDISSNCFPSLLFLFVEDSMLEYLMNSDLIKEKYALRTSSSPFAIVEGRIRFTKANGTITYLSIGRPFLALQVILTPTMYCEYSLNVYLLSHDGIEYKYDLDSRDVRVRPWRPLSVAFQDYLVPVVSPPRFRLD